MQLIEPEALAQRRYSQRRGNQAHTHCHAKGPIGQNLRQSSTQRPAATIAADCCWERPPWQSLTTGASHTWNGKEAVPYRAFKPRLPSQLVLGESTRYVRR